jgi:hypothetical protein
MDAIGVLGCACLCFEFDAIGSVANEVQRSVRKSCTDPGESRNQLADAFTPGSRSPGVQV